MCFAHAYVLCAIERIGGGILELSCLICMYYKHIDFLN